MTFFYDLKENKNELIKCMIELKWMTDEWIDEMKRTVNDWWCTVKYMYVCFYICMCIFCPSCCLCNFKNLLNVEKWTKKILKTFCNSEPGEIFFICLKWSVQCWKWSLKWVVLHKAEEINKTEIWLTSTLLF